MSERVESKLNNQSSESQEDPSHERSVKMAGIELQLDEAMLGDPRALNGFLSLEELNRRYKQYRSSRR